MRQITFQVNPEQIPVLTVEQSLYVIAKIIQWPWLDVYGEKYYVILMGCLYIEIAILKVTSSWERDINVHNPDKKHPTQP